MLCSDAETMKYINKCFTLVVVGSKYCEHIDRSRSHLVGILMLKLRTTFPEVCGCELFVNLNVHIERFAKILEVLHTVLYSYLRNHCEKFYFILGVPKNVPNFDALF